MALTRLARAARPSRIAPLLILLTSAATLGCTVGACSDKGAENPFPPDWPRPKFETGKMTVDGRELTIELADTSRLRRYGYMFVTKPPSDDEGMLFMYPTPIELGFWMRNTRVPLDLVYIDDAGTILNIHREMIPGNEEPGRYEALKPCRFALEVRGGWCDDHHVYAGKKAEIPESIRTRAAEANVPLTDGEGGNIPRFPAPR